MTNLLSRASSASIKITKHANATAAMLVMASKFLLVMVLIRG